MGDGPACQDPCPLVLIIMYSYLVTGTGTDFAAVRLLWFMLVVRSTQVLVSIS